MLVLTRKVQERIRIGDNIVVTVLRVNGNSVRLGLEAPPEVTILRGELPRFDESEPGPGEAADQACGDKPSPETPESGDGASSDLDGPAASSTAMTLSAHVQHRVRQLAAAPSAS